SSKGVELEMQKNEQKTGD
ncbi:hypothetical protein A2U01_0089983, partial [Trifolium medium]|nr:hypothetical protein [Trifolium medium]